MRITRRIFYPEVPGKGRNPTVVDPTFPIHYLESGSEVRAGFEKGTLTKARFELENGHVIEYERNSDSPSRSAVGHIGHSENLTVTSKSKSDGI